jgi:hypothetical protein
MTSPMERTVRRKALMVRGGGMLILTGWVKGVAVLLVISVWRRDKIKP